MAEFRLGANARREYAAIAWDRYVIVQAPAIKAAISAEAPVDTGELAGSVIYRTISGTGDLPRIRFIATADHAAVVSRGHGEIFPHNPSGAMIFLWRIVANSRKQQPFDEDVRLGRVGPYPGRPFMTDALRKMGLHAVRENYSPRR